MSRPTIEYFYSTHSAFAYLGSAKLESVANVAGYGIEHKPVDYSQVVGAARGKHFKGYSDAHRAYFFGREIQRWAQFRQAPAIDYRPTHHDNDLTPSSAMIIAAVQAGLNADRLAHGILQAHWRDDANHADPNTLIQIADAAGYDGASLLARATDEDVLTVYKRNTEEAIDRCIFGSPTYFVAGDMFYGQDRLEMIEHVLATDNE